MQTIIKILTFTIFLFIIGIFYLSLNKDKSYNTKNLLGKKLDKIILENFNGNGFLVLLRR